MKKILICFILVFIACKKEQKNKNDTKEEENKNMTKGIFPNGQIYELNDQSIDFYIRQGNVYRWFLLCYSRTCGHCRRAKTQISKLFQEYKTSENIRFGEIEIGDNAMSHTRFNINGVPYIVLIENNTMLELDLYPNYDNLKKFINSNFTEVKNETKQFPAPVNFSYVAWRMFKQSFLGFLSKFNSFLKNKFGFQKQITPLIFIIAFLGTISLCCFSLYFCCMKCCCSDEDFEKEIKELDEYYKNHPEDEDGGEEVEGEEDEEGEEIEDEEGEEIEDEEGEEIEDEEDQQELTEEEKKKLEEDRKEEERKKKEEEERIKREEEERKKKEEEERKKEKKNKNKKKNKKKKD